jgi:amino acid adenylation domain-containing protein
LPTWTDTLPANTLTSLFERAVADGPDRPAVSDDHETLSYAELDRRSDEFAAGLREHGVEPGGHVAVYLDRSVSLIVSILGVVKLGAAYVPIDTRYPSARRDLLIQRTGAKLMVTRPELSGELGDVGADLVTPDLAATVVPVPGEVEPSTVASILCTSGSTGLPKAIVLEHRNLVSFVCNPALTRLTPSDRVGQISSISFDAFTYEMWATLVHGAHLVVLPAVPDLLAADFQRQMRRYRISAMLVPTMVVNHVVREDRDAFASLRLLQVGGDVLLPSACADLFAGSFSGELVNLYGPAEISTACTSHRVTPADAQADSIPIGRPLDGVAVYLLSPDGEQVGAGEVGEMFVSGPGVARGYLGDAELTAQRFQANLFPGGTDRMYRTGDLARCRADGVLEFVGRADDQVKVRGYRVEPGEVERTLRRHPEVYDAVVLADGEPGDRRLTAFVIGQQSLVLRDLRDFAEAELPEFMVPSHFVTITEVPVTVHGKRDLDGLREQIRSERDRQQRHVPPGTETERYLARLWEDLLGVERVGGTDEFFALGGHSLQAFRVQRRVRRDLGVDVQYRDLLRNAVLRDLAAVIDSARDEA